MLERISVPDLPRQFNSLNAEGERLAVWEGFGGKPFEDDRYSIWHDGGGGDNHFQGIRRVEQHLFVTGSYPYRPKRGDLFIFEMGSRSADPGPWGSNLVRSREPPSTDRLVLYHAIDSTFWHPGSPAILGDTLVVPLERAPLGDSLVAFLDISNPSSPRPAPVASISRPRAKAGALAATCLPSGHVLLAVWSDSDLPAAGGEAPFHCDFYVSAAPQTLAGFRLVASYEPVKGSPFYRKFQGLDLLWDKSGPDGRLFFLGFDNPVRPQPHPRKPGQNRVALYEVHLPNEWLAPDQIAAGAPRKIPNLVSPVDEHVFTHAGDWYSTDAGAGAYVDSNQQLIVYSVAHHRNPVRGTLAVKCMEFRSTDFQNVIDRIEDAWVELYEGPGPTGRRLTLLGPWDSSIENATRCYSEDRAWKAVSVVRYQIPVDRAYVLYPERNFQGAGPVVLQGSGAVTGMEISSGRPYSVGSGRFLPLSVAAALPGARVLA